MTFVTAVAGRLPADAMLSSEERESLSTMP